MSKNKKYFIDKDDLGGECLVLCDSWVPQLSTVIERKKIQTLRLSFSAGWKDDNLEFIDEVPGSVIGFEVYSWKVTDLSPLLRRANVELLSFQVELKRVLDLGKLKALRTLKFAWSAKVKNMDKCVNLQHLNIIAYPAADLNMIKNMNKLVRLQIMSTKLQSTKGISSLNCLRSLDFARCPNLISLDGINELMLLEDFELTDCKSIFSIPNLAPLSYLKSILLEDCADIQNVQFLSENKNLERVLIIGDTKISDRNLDPLKGLPNAKDIRVGN